MSARPPLFIPLRDSDLTNTKTACQACAEKIIAGARLPAECVSTADGGLLILIDQSKSSRRWHPDPQKAKRCHLLNLVEQDPALGVYSLSTRAINSDVLTDQYVVICSWHHLPLAAEHLWLHCLGPAIAKSYFGLDKHLAEMVAALGLQERPVNHQPPGYSITRHGALLRFAAAATSAFNQYFLLEEILSGPTEPESIELGAGCSLVYLHSADPVEPARAIIATNSWSVEMAIKELRRSARHDRKEFPVT
jgi:hypothetical protein